MNFTCQKYNIDELQKLANMDRHSILIEGSIGCGKSYLARQYANMLQVQDFISISPKVSDIRDTIDQCMKLDNNLVLCIENLDTGVAGASYALLKILEEPLPNIYIVITCRNVNAVPDTIISRSAVISVNPPTIQDLDLYSRSIDADKYMRLKDNMIWKCVRTLHDVNTVLSMSNEHLLYFNTFNEICKFTDSVSNIVWKLGHFEDNTDTPIELVIRCIMEIMNTNHVRRCGIECISDLSLGRIASHAVLAKFAFECKYYQ